MTMQDYQPEEPQPDVDRNEEQSSVDEHAASGNPAADPDPQTALPQTTEWSNAPVDKVGLSDDQAELSAEDDRGA